MSRRRARFTTGDVFSIAIADDHVAYAQIVAPWPEGPRHWYFGAFAGAHPRAEEPGGEAVVSEPLTLLALSMDALLAHGHWQVVGHCKVRTEEIPWPAYKEGVSPAGTYDVVDHTGRRRRRATLQEAERLPFRTVVAPILLEKALRALHGAEPWDEIYDGMRLVESDRTAAALQLT